MDGKLLSLAGIGHRSAEYNKRNKLFIRSLNRFRLFVCHFVLINPVV